MKIKKLGNLFVVIVFGTQFMFVQNTRAEQQGSPSSTAIGQESESFLDKAISKANYFAKSAWDTTVSTSKDFINKLVAKPKDNFDKVVSVACVVTLSVITIYVIKKMLGKKKGEAIEDYAIWPDGQFNLHDKSPRNLERYLNNKCLWSIWPRDMSFSELLQIPNKQLINMLILEIQRIYSPTTVISPAQPKAQVETSSHKPDNQITQQNPDYTLEKACEGFIIDIDKELDYYTQKLNLALLNKARSSQKVISKIKEKIAKLIYLKNTLTSWVPQSTQNRE